MPVRQKHKKSRGGCNQCKLRRTKCDENGPPCYNCIARELVCQYSQRAQLTRKAREPSHSQQVAGRMDSGTKLLLHNNIHPQPGNRQFELALMHHWTAQTYLTFCHQKNQPAEEGERRLWQVVVPHEGLNHDYCLKALFAVTSLHLASLASSPLHDGYLTAAMDYHNSSLELFRENLLEVTDDNCQAMYACSLAHFVLGIALSEIDQTRNTHKSVKENIISVLALFAGSKQIMSLFERQLSQMPIALAITPKSMQSFPRKDLYFAEAASRLTHLNRARYQEQSPKTYERNQVAIDQLDASSTRSVNGVEAALIGWLMSLDADFITALKGNEIISTLSMMHWATLIERSSHLWWTFKSSTCLLVELSHALTGLTLAEQAACDWCLDQIKDVPLR